MLTLIDYFMLFYDLLPFYFILMPMPPLIR